MTILPITPVAKPRMTQRDRWAKRPVVEAYYAFKDKLRSLTERKGYQLGEQIRIVFLLPMPPSWSGKKRVMMRGKPHKQTPDLDNLIKGFTDALTEQDAAVWNIAAVKLWSENGAIEVENVELREN